MLWRKTEASPTDTLRTEEQGAEGPTGLNESFAVMPGGRLRQPDRKQDNR